MKKIKTIFCALVLSSCLVGNAFAGDFTIINGVNFFSFFSDAANAVVTFLRSGECPPRQCTTCKTGGDSDPDCKPTN